MPSRPQEGLYLTLGNELSKETHLLMKQDTIEKGPLEWRAARSGNPGLLCLLVRSLRFYGGGINFWVVTAPSPCLCPYMVWLRAFPGGMRVSRWRQIPAWEFLGGWQDILWPSISSFFSAPPKFFGLAAACHFLVPHWNLLVRDNLCKWLFSSLVRAEGFSPWFPNIISS